MRRRDSHQFEGKIWNMIADPRAHYLLLEIRQEIRHQVSFALLDLKEDHLVWKEVTFEEPWWIGATATDGKTLVLHIFEDTQNPEAKRFIAVDIKSRKTIWQSATFQVIAIREEWLLGYEKQDDQRLYQLVSMKDQSSTAVSEEERERLLEAENKNLRFPFHYTETHPYFDTVKQFIIQYTHTTPVRGCEYLEQQDLILMSYYIHESQALANYLLVIDQEGRLCLQEKLDQALTQIGLGTFFTTDDHLVLIKEKSQLISYAL